MRTKLILNLLKVFAFMSLISCLFLNSRLLSVSSIINSPQPLAQSSTNFKRLAVIVPFRDRFTELLTFVPHLSKFLTAQNIPFIINIINQNDSYRFNRASLINVGFSLVQDSCDYIAMHDVDLLPLNPNLSYKYPETGPFHVSSPSLHPKYHYDKFVGGILLISNEHFKLVNGLSNRYWGWGLEDDEFYLRIRDAKLHISRPINIDSGIGNTFLHIHDPNIRKRDYAKLFNQKEVTRRRDTITGLRDVKFKMTSQSKITIEGKYGLEFMIPLIPFYAFAISLNFYDTWTMDAVLTVSKYHLINEKGCYFLNEKESHFMEWIFYG